MNKFGNLSLKTLLSKPLDPERHQESVRAAPGHVVRRACTTRPSRAGPDPERSATVPHSATLRAELVPNWGGY